jgi:hypothetical protein
MPANHPLVRSSFDERAAVLRERFQEIGYLYFPEYVASRKCSHLLQEFLGCLDGQVVFDSHKQNPVLRGEPFFETDPVWDAVYPKMQSLHPFHEFFHDADLGQLMQLVVGDQVFVYPMKMARIATPRKIGFETPPHQDAHSHQGGPSMAGIWVALHEVREGMGRLKLLPESHQRGVRNVFSAPGVGGVQCEIFPDENVWHVSDVSQGDVIVFHSCCVHSAEPNTSVEDVRISVDTRFCDFGEPVFVTNLEPHHGWRIDGLDWPGIYSDWPDAELKYYWRDYPNLTSELRGQ